MSVIEKSFPYLMLMVANDLLVQLVVPYHDVWYLALICYTFYGIMNLFIVCLTYAEYTLNGNATYSGNFCIWNRIKFFVNILSLFTYFTVMYYDQPTPYMFVYSLACVIEWTAVYWALGYEAQTIPIKTSIRLPFLDNINE